MKPENDWTTQQFIAWGQYLIAAIECDWPEDMESAIREFTARYGRRASDGELDGYDDTGGED